MHLSAEPFPFTILHENPILTQVLFSGERIMLATLLAAVMLAPAPKVEPPRLPNGPPPTFAVVRMNKEGQLVQRVIVQVAVPVEKQIEVNVMGRVEIRKVTTYVRESRQEERTLLIKGLQAFDSAGKKVDEAKLPQLLRNDTLVLLASDGQMVDPFYLQIIKEGTLILMLPLSPAPPPLPDKPPMPR
jgi:hypothetical protein